MTDSKRGRLFRFLIILVALFSFFGAYLHFGIFPGDLRLKLIRKINASAPISIDFDKALYLPFKGLYLHHVKIFDSTGTPVLFADKIIVDGRLLPFLKEKKIILSKITLDKPIYVWTIDEETPKVPTATPMTQISGQIPVPIIPENQPPRISDVQDIPNAFLPENVYLEEVQIHEGFVIVKRNKGAQIIERLHSIELTVQFEKKPRLEIKGSLKAGQPAYAALQIQGFWNLKKTDYEFAVQAQSDHVPDWLIELQKNHVVIFKKGRFSVDARFKNLEESHLLFHAKTVATETELSLNQMRYAGGVAVDANGIYNTSAKTFARYRGNLNLADGRLLNLSDEISEIRPLEGKIFFEPDSLTFQSMRGQYKNIPFEASGSLLSFTEPSISVEIRTRSNIDQLIGLVPDSQKKLIEDFDLKGLCQTVTTVKGSLKNPNNLVPEHQLSIEQGSIVSKDKKVSVTNLSAIVGTTPNGFKIQNGQFQYLGKNYSLKAFVPLNQAIGSLELGSEDLKVSGEYLLGQNAVFVRKTAVDYPGFQAHFEGQLKNFKDPSIDIVGQLNVDLEKINALLKKSSTQALDLSPRGILGGNFALKGLWNQPINWDLKWDARGAGVRLKEKIKIDDVEMQIRLQNKLLHIPYLRASGYQGLLISELFFDLTNSRRIFNSKTFVHNVNLRPLTQDLGLGQKEIDGTLHLQLAMGGDYQHPETIQGNGSMDIEQGRLWETNLFKQMGSLPFVRVEGLDWVTFRRLSTLFGIHDKRIWTQNLNLFGDTVDLSLMGSIGFDQTLDLLMAIHFSNSVLEGAYLTGGLVPFVVQQAENFISRYRITGTLKSPRLQKT